MAVRYKLEAELNLKVLADEYYQDMKTRVFSFSTICVDGIAWDTLYSPKVYAHTYDIGDENNQTFKERGDYDDEELMITMTGLEGFMLRGFSNYKCNFKAIHNDAGGCTVRHIIEYETLLGDSAPGAHEYLDYIVGLSKGVEAHLLKS